MSAAPPWWGLILLLDGFGVRDLAVVAVSRGPAQLLEGLGEDGDRLPRGHALFSRYRAQNDPVCALRDALHFRRLRWEGRGRSSEGV